MCYQRYNKEFVPNKNQGKGNNTRRSFGQNPATFITTHNPNPFVATLETIGDFNWYDGSGATNHVTADFNHIANPTDYTGNEQVTVGNGESLCISTIGNSCLNTNKCDLNLENVLCVPVIAKNLVSILKLA